MRAVLLFFLQTQDALVNSGPFSAARLVLILGTLNLCAPSAQCQGRPGPSEHWELGLSGGFLVPHRGVIRSLIDGHASQIQLNWSRTGRGVWSCSRTQPRWGLGLRFGESGASGAVGKQASLLGMAELRIVHGLDFRFGAGIGWTQNQWSTSTPEDRQHVVIGSPINAAIEVGLHRPPLARPSGAWHNLLGFHFCLAHQSNASFTQPNLGTNVASLGISALVKSRSPQRSLASDTLAVLSFLPPPVLGWTIHAGIGRRQPAPLASRETPVEWGFDHRWGKGLRLGGTMGINGYSRPSELGLGIHAGFQLRFSTVYIDLVHGRYLKRWQPEEHSYNRVVINVHLSRHLWSKLALHTHGFRAHHPSLGLVWSFGHRSTCAK